MTGVPTIHVLRTARKLVANPKTWTKSCMARAANGREVGVRDGRAVKFCAMGAIYWSARHAGLCENVFNAINPLENALDRIGQRMFGHSASCMMGVNDVLGRRAALRVIDAAIAELEAQ